MFALPIASVHEVAEIESVCCVPTIPKSVVGVMNWHGDALPLVATCVLLECGESTDGDKRSVADDLVGVPVLIVSARDDQPAQLGLPIDRVIGLIDGEQRRGGGQLVVERRPVEGRVVNVLDPRRLVTRAHEVIESEVT